MIDVPKFWQTLRQVLGLSPKMENKPVPTQIELKAIQDKLAKKAILFTTGGLRPTYSRSESWIGRVYWYHKEEGIPMDDSGKLMLPLFQLCLEGLPFIPESLIGTQVITLFVSEELPMDVTPNGKNWLLREYKDFQSLQVKDLTNPASSYKAFPLSTRVIERDFPAWEDEIIPKTITSQILALENMGAITEYAEIAQTQDGHKLGGYPAFIQGGVDFGEGFEFVLQIASDSKVYLNVIDNGNMYLAKNKKTGEWRFYCDFF